MATSKPRITITLEPHRHELLRRLAAHQGVSMSSIVVDLLETVAPVLERVCVAIESAKKAQDSVRVNLVRMAEESEQAVQPLLAQAMGQLDIFLSACGDAAQSEGTPPRGEDPTPQAATNPRPVTRGSGPKKKGKAASPKGGDKR